MRRWIPWWVLALLFVVLPIAELYVLIQVGQVIGAGWTVLLLVADAVLGSWLMKREGGRAWRALRQALDDQRMPARELADGALILVGGTLLVTPGFLSDIVGFFCVLPFTRPVARRALTAWLTRKFLRGPGAPGYAAHVNASAWTSDGSRTGRRPGPDSSVVQGDVVE